MLAQSHVVADSVDDSGRTPLSYAAESGNVEALQLLLNRDDVARNSVDFQGLTPLDYALSYTEAHGDEAIVELFFNERS